MSNFYNRLSYSFGNEDWKTERQALRIAPGDRVICITASGDRPLNLLVDDSSELVCIDLNQIQNHLLNLKIAAMKTLDYSDYLAFLGVLPSKHRREMLKKILPFLEKDAGIFWKLRPSMIEEGILYQGALERWAKKIASTISFFRKAKVERLFSFDDIQEQKLFLQKEWNHWLWRRIFDLNLYPMFTRLFLRDPALSFGVDPGIKIGPYIYNRMNACLEQDLAKSNSFLSLFMKGYVLPDAYPPYLTEKGTKQIKSKLDRLSIQTTDLVEYLKSCPDNHFDAFSVSDVASYLSKNRFEELLNQVLRTAKADARFSIRQFLSSHTIPPHLKQHFQREDGLENRLEKEDFCFIYRFIVGKIKKESRK